MKKFPVFTADLIPFLEKIYPLKPLSIHDIRDKTKEEIAFEAGQRSVVEYLKTKQRQAEEQNVYEQTQNP